ncbi:MAG TPA: DNA-processing protein DprA, partial [Methylomirabilota bacterium]|nr:DNA-processing protein DprA [Methylomirabilota bacterium]
MGRRKFKAGLPVRTLRPGDPSYPRGLCDLAAAPKRVYLVGPWDHPGPFVAVVGSRNATQDGLDVARDLARSL